MLSPGKINILIGCERSGKIRDAFRRLGFNAWSCDPLPSKDPTFHIQDKIQNHLDSSYHLLIAHPPCTYLAYSGNAYFNQPGRARERIKALAFVEYLWSAPIKHIALENPKGIIDHVITKHSQVIQPYYFGDQHFKTTCLWLKNLPKLSHIKHPDLFQDQTHTAKPQPIYIDKSGNKLYLTEAISGTKKETDTRSITFDGIANAMAYQWSEYLLSHYNK